MQRPITSTIISILALAVAACGSDDASPPAADAAANAEPEADAEPDANDGGDGAATADPTLIADDVCDLLDGTDVTGLGTVTLAQTLTPNDSTLTCVYRGGPGARFSISLGGSAADVGILEDFVASGEATPVDGLADVAILQPSQGVRAAFAESVLLTVSAYGSGTADDGAREIDAAASETMARLLVDHMADRLP